MHRLSYCFLINLSHVLPLARTSRLLPFSNEIDRSGTGHLYLFTTYSMLNYFVDAYLIIGFVFGISD